MDRMTINDVLSLKYLSSFKWSPCGKFLAYVWNDGGVSNLWLVNADGSVPARQITNAKKGVSAYTWTSEELFVISDGNVEVYSGDLDRENAELMTTAGGYRGRLVWSKESQCLAYTNGRILTFSNSETFETIDIHPLGEVFAGKFSQTVRGDSFAWSPSGDKFMYTFVDEKQTPYLAIVLANGKHIWRSDGHVEQIGDAQFLDDNRFVYALRGRYGAQTTYYLGTIPPETEWKDYSHINAVSQFVLLTQKLITVGDPEEKGAFYSSVTPIPNGDNLILTTEDDGYLHHYLFDLATGAKEQLTFGECVDYGQMGDEISFSPCGKYFVFASNRTQRVERQLWIYDLEKSEMRQLTDLPVTNTLPQWSPTGDQIAFFHADKRRNGDLWVVDIDGKECTQLSFSMPEGLADKLVESEHVTYRGALDWELDAFLYKPTDFDPKRQYPAIVWVHGGPMRQMRGSWHVSATYAHFYALNQFLANQGYVVLSPNFRGGIGYGRDFRLGLYQKKGIDDTIDIVNAGQYLRDLPYVKNDMVAVYGLSYGGYMTLHALTQYPESFAMGINIAGLWDIAQWGRWLDTTYGNYQGDANFCGRIEEHPDLWAAGSPVHYKEGLCKPLMSLQGTADPNVDFSQLDLLTKDCVAMGADHTAVYYPDEMHTFRWRRTWQDALPRMITFFADHLSHI